MKKTYMIFLMMVLFITYGSYAQVTNTVTFNVDMTQMLQGGFDPGTDSIMIQGLVWEPGYGVTVEGNRILQQDGTEPTLFKTTLVINSGTAVVGDSLRWKFYIWPNDNIIGGGWEGGFGDYDGRPYYIREEGAVVNLDPVIPNFQYVVTGLGPQNTFHIMADLTDLIGSGEGYFDPTIDQLIVEGFVWEAMATVVSGDRTMIQNPLLPGVIYETSLLLELDTAYVVGDSLRWKLHAIPENRWANGGWEVGVGRYTVFQEDGSVLEIGPLVPDITALFTLQEDVHILFQIDMNHDATNRYDSSAIPLDQIEFMTIRGSHSVLGSWVGNWTEQDTISPGVPVLNDSGVLGDKVAGDNIWSRVVTFPAGTPGGATAYKYGVYYPGCELISATYYMDGYGGTGEDLTCAIAQRPDTVEILDIWPHHGEQTSVEKLNDMVPEKFTLEQNYPNPFNPTTIIRYSIKEATDVRLSVYNLLGEKIIMLVDKQQQEAGVYEVSFDASNLASGVYFYRLSTPEQNITRKMLLLR